eukprot:scaffold73021_cov61-Phaeocystis_antarctica.AAC.5
MRICASSDKSHRSHPTMTNSIYSSGRAVHTHRIRPTPLLVLVFYGVCKAVRSHEATKGGPSKVTAAPRNARPSARSSEKKKLESATCKVREGPRVIHSDGRAAPAAQPPLSNGRGQPHTMCHASAVRAAGCSPLMRPCCSPMWSALCVERPFEYLVRVRVRVSSQG